MKGVTVEISVVILCALRRGAPKFDIDIAIINAGHVGPPKIGVRF